jgi:hypothetical protein
MNYRVVWRRRAKRELAAAWLGAADRNAVSDAANRIDQALGHDPETYGESRAGNYRIGNADPLSVFFRVNPLGRVVYVVSIGLARHGG